MKPARIDHEKAIATQEHPLLNIIDELNTRGSDYWEEAVAETNRLLAEGFDINTPYVTSNGSQYGTPLIFAIRRSKSGYDYAKLLIESGADIDMVGCSYVSDKWWYGLSPLTELISNTKNEETWSFSEKEREEFEKRQKSAEEFLEYFLTLNPFLENTEEIKPITLAVLHENESVFNTLLNAHPYDLQDEEVAGTILKYAQNQYGMVERFLGMGIPVDTPDHVGNTLLLRACSEMDIDAIKKYLHFGANKELRNNITSEPSNPLNEYDYEKGQNWLARLRNKYLRQIDKYGTLYTVIDDSVKEHGFGNAKVSVSKIDYDTGCLQDSRAIEDHPLNEEYQKIVNLFEDPGLDEYYRVDFTLDPNDIESYKTVLTEFTALIADTDSFKKAARTSDGALRFYPHVKNGNGTTIYDFLSEAVKKGVEQELYDLFDLLIDFDEPLYDRPFSIFGFNALMALNCKTDRYLERSYDFLIRNCAGKPLLDYYDHYGWFSQVMYKRKDRDSMALIIQGIEAKLSPDPDVFARRLKNEGKLFDLFWNTYEEIAPESVPKQREAYLETWNMLYGD